LFNYGVKRQSVVETAFAKMSAANAKAVGA
jgi:hypothetical protein